jgi:hexosaminidase
MLDVARHFFDVNEVKRLIDLAAHHKLNRFHLHLTDDQGWRIQIDSWPNLTTTGGSSEVGGGPGGYYTKADFAEIVDYAADRYVVIVPEIDMPGHTNAALASYPDELTPSGDPPRAWPYTGTEVGFSSLWVNGGSTNQFVADVLGEVAEMTPGPYLHIGGDEADTLDADDYADFIEGLETLVTSLDKTLVGWADISQASLSSSSIAQFWSPSSVDTLTDAVARGMGVIMSPADVAYLDMKYDDGTPVGHDWAGFTSVQEAYEWDPVTGNSPASSVVGVEAPLWTETVDSRADIDLLAFPRLSGIAEIGWSAAGRDFGEYAMRLSLHENRLTAWGVGFYQ